MDRRDILRKLGAAPLSVGLFGSTSGSESTKYPSIREEYLDEYGWKKGKNPELPNELPNKEIEDESRWGLISCIDDHVTPAVRDQTQTDGEIDTQVMEMVAGRVSGAGRYKFDSEWSEVGTDIDGVAEEVLEEVILSRMDDLEIGLEYHIKSTRQLLELTVGQIPWAGEVISTSLSYLWDTPESVTTRNGKTPYIAQYTASKTLKANDEEYEVDYRGLYIDWFHDDDLYAALVFYPKNKEVLREAVLELTGVDLDFENDMSFEREAIKVLSGIGKSSY